MKKKKSSAGQWVISAIVVVVAIAVGVFIWRKATQAGGGKAPVAASSTAANAGQGPAHASTAIQHPIAQAGPAPASTSPLPALDASDTSVADGLLALAGGDALDGLLHRQQIIRRVVATVDALPRQSVGSNILPVQTPKGAFLVEQGDGAVTLSPRNAERYAPYMRVLDGTDPKALVAWYVAHYPLFQQAYRDLGYPKGYFNDRLIAAIDDMLAAPVPEAPVQLVQPKVFYRYADAGLETRSAGQKMLMRMGADNEARVKAKLRQIRDLLTGVTLPASSSSAQ
ncbi:DUF3014 domain-containing protein [Frateuria sp. STR12]|uniref:DUF3014 domain-containing protein n=1 Tax=Frateuria hangzhouensis TaxID=2995589 RepID=UPI002260D358|nr:DUF3014 domain-containing protein [Frateuria sp. STR12]MCX7515353.1 DUF3014 domain-containing protein [Frateuria sp. STR12]